MDAVDYDIVLLGCGAYGFPLAAYAKRRGKQAIHMGGSLQLLFGIKGKRWEDQNYAIRARENVQHCVTQVCLINIGYALLIIGLKRQMLWKMDVIGNNKLKYLMKVINIKDRLFNIINIVFT